MTDLRWSVLLCLASALGAQERADTIYYNANVVTVSEEQPRAAAVAIRGDRFLAVGSNKDISSLQRAMPGKRNDCFRPL